MKLSAKLPHDDVGASLVRFENVRGQRYSEIFLIGGHAITGKLVAGVYNTVGLNNPTGTGDSCPQAVLNRVDVDSLTGQYDVLSAVKNGPRLWCLDWVEVLVGVERDFNGLKARWVMWLDVPKEMRKHESLAYKPIGGRRDTQLGIDKGSPAFILDDPEGKLLGDEVRRPHRRPGPDLREPRGPRRPLEPCTRLEVPDRGARPGPGPHAGQRLRQDHPGRAGKHLRPGRWPVQHLHAVMLSVQMVAG